ncbi:hypothetical protein EPO34_00510 [Patescibacteria group bacterium]|nr:MAG: hypothetical protein EPO34_00510 [Patescibacteria group bacterium]
MKEIPKPGTERLKKALMGHPAFSDVDHARRPDSVDGSAWECEANVLAFSYRERPYFAHVGDEVVQVTRPGGSGRERMVGRFVRTDASDLARALAAAIDAAVHE